MLKLLVIGALLCVPQASAEKIIAAIVREVKLPDYWPSYTLTIEPHILTIAQNLTHLLVNSIDPNFKSCAIACEEHTIQHKIQATVIDRKIVVWGVRTRHRSQRGVRVEHVVLIVDPWQCSFKVASTFEEEKLPDSWAVEIQAQVVRVAEEESFDVFYPSLKTCAPCRYTISGKRVDLKHQIEVNNTRQRNYDYSDFEFFRIQSYYELGHEEGYIYAHNFENGSSLIKLLDGNFRLVKQKFLDHKMHMTAANPAPSSTGVYVCYMTGEPYRFGKNTNDTIYCERFDADLNLSWRIRLPMLQGHVSDALSMIVGPSGDLFIPVVQSVLRNSVVTKFGYYQVDPNGRLCDATIVYQLPNISFGRWEIRGFSADKMYCIENTPSHEFVKCVNIQQCKN